MAVLHELHAYAKAHDLPRIPGFGYRNVKGYLSLSATGEIIGFEPAMEEAYCPDMGSAAQTTNKCSILMEKASILFPKEKKDQAKHEFFLKALLDGSKAVPAFGICALAIEKEQTRAEMMAELSKQKIKPGDIIGFKVDGKALEQDIDSYLSWWEKFRAEHCEIHGKGISRCLVTGDLTPPARTVAKVSGLIGVGGHTAGDSLACFDKPAFQSYGLKQGENAAVSDEISAAVNASLRALIHKAPTLAGAKWIHWYDTEIPEDADPLMYLNERRKRAAQSEEEEGEDEITQEEAKQEETAREASNASHYVERANQLIGSAKKGTHPEILRARYHILSLSGASGRMMIRAYTQGSYLTLTENISQWQADLRIVTPGGKGETQVPKLFAMNIRLLGTKSSAGVRSLGERIGKELSSLETQLILAIIEGKPLPDTVASRALQYIRSDMQAASDDENNHSESIAFQLIKAWLLRKQRERGGMITVQERLNDNNRSPAYLAGRMMAAYAKIQEAALGSDLNAGVVQRYYTAASNTPALVIGRLSGLSQHHLSKIDNKGTRIFFEKMITNIADLAREGFPKILSLEERTEFALGYYQQLAEIYRGKIKEDE